jgi:hypothetical protein
MIAIALSQTIQPILGILMTVILRDNRFKLPIFLSLEADIITG